MNPSANFRQQAVGVDARDVRTHFGREPLPWVHPYIFGGIGYERVAVVGSSAARAGSPLFSSGQPDLPLGFGFDVPLTWRLSVGFEATYHFQLGESYSNDTTNGIDGGDISTFNAVLRGRF